MSVSPPKLQGPNERTGHLIVTLIVIVGCFALMLIHPGSESVTLPIMSATAGHYLGYTQVNGQ